MVVQYMIHDYSVAVITRITELLHDINNEGEYSKNISDINRLINNKI